MSGPRPWGRGSWGCTGVWRVSSRRSSGGAANDPELASYYREIVASIRENWAAVYDHDLTRGWVRVDRPREEVIDVWCMAASPEAYLRVTRNYGWSDEQYASWLCSAYRDIWLGPIAMARR